MGVDQRDATRRQPVGRRPALSGVRAVVTATVAGALLLTAAPADAHTRLESSDPAAGERSTVAPASVRLVFSDPVDEQFASAALTGDGRAGREVPVDVDGRVVVAQVPDDVGPGDWRLDFRVVSADGHPVSGTVPFEVAGEPGQAASAPAPATSTTAPSLQQEDDASAAAGESEASLLWPSALGVGVLLAAGLVARTRRRRSADR